MDGADLEADPPAAACDAALADAAAGPETTAPSEDASGTKRPADDGDSGDSVAAKRQRPDEDDPAVGQAEATAEQPVNDAAQTMKDEAEATRKEAAAMREEVQRIKRQDLVEIIAWLTGLECDDPTAVADAMHARGYRTVSQVAAAKLTDQDLVDLGVSAMRPRKAVRMLEPCQSVL